jgi:hypothetical protein
MPTVQALCRLGRVAGHVGASPATVDVTSPAAAAAGADEVACLDYGYSFIRGR